MSLLPRLLDRIRSSGPVTVAEFMELSLYDPQEGYYAAAGQRSGRGGDFFTSVDVGPLFGEFLAEFVARAWAAWRAQGGEGTFDLVEAGAGNGRLARDVLDALALAHPECHRALRVALVERSASARAEQAGRLGPHAGRLAVSSDQLPVRIDGVLLANELLDAFAVHRVRMTGAGLAELFVGAEGDTLVLVEGRLSTPRLGTYFDDVGVSLSEGAVADVSLAAADWVATALARMARGLALFVDYGHDADQLYRGHLLGGTLVSYARHQLDPSGSAPSGTRPAWLEGPGTRDLTAHVDFTAVTRAAAAAGARREFLVDQTVLLMGLGADRLLGTTTGDGVADVKRRLAAQALMTPLGLGGSHKALVLSKGLSGAVPLLDA